MNYNTGKLQVTLPSDLEIEVTREFAAPCALVFAAHTKPEMVQRWLLGPDGWTMPVCEIDLQVGGRYRYVWRNAGSGQEFGVTGSYLEIVTPTILGSTERFEGMPEMAESVNRMVLTEHHGRTRLLLTMRYPSKEARDGAIASGMNVGMEAGYARLEGLLPTFSLR